MSDRPEDSVPDMDVEVRKWIEAMFHALGLGQPSFATGADMADKDGGQGETSEGIEGKRATLVKDLSAIVLPERMPTEETLRTERQIESVRKVLDAARSSAELDKVETAIGKLTEVAAGLARSMEERRAKAAVMARTLSGLALPDVTYLAPDEVPDLNGAKVKIASDLSGPIGEQMLATCQDAVNKLSGELNIAKAISSGRAKRVEIVQTGFAAIERPVGGTPEDYTKYDAQLPAIDALKTPPVTDALLGAAEAALAELKSESERLTAAIKAREEKRREFVGRVLVLVPPLSARGSKALKVLKDGGKLRKALADAKTLKYIEAQEPAIAALEKAIKEMEELAVARDKAAKELGAAEIAVKAASKKLISAAYNKVVGMLAKAQGDFDAAQKITEYQSVGSQLAKIAPYVSSVEGYLVDTPKWRYDTELYVDSLPDDTPTKAALKTAMGAWRDKLLSDADAFAVQGELGKAKAELDKFFKAKTKFVDPADSTEKEVGVDATHDAAAKGFALKVATFVSGSMPVLDVLKRFGFGQVAGSLKGEFTAAKKEGYQKGDFATANAQIEALATKLAEAQSFLNKYEQYREILVGATAPSHEKTARDGLETDCTAKDFVAALGKLTALEGHLGEAGKKAALYKGARAKLKRRVEGALATIAGAAGNALSAAWGDAETEADHDKKMARLSEAEAALPGLESLINAKEGAEALLARHDSGDTYALLADAASKLTAGNVPGATTAYQTAQSQFEELAKYLETASRVSALKATLPSTDAAGIKEMEDALAAADVKAKAFAWGDADKLLGAILDKPEMQVVEAGLKQYQDRRRQVEGLQGKILARMIHPKAREKLETPWTAIEKAGETDKDYLLAADLLSAHVSLIDEANVYIEAAFRTRKALASLHNIADVLDAETADATAKANMKAAIYPNGATKAQLEDLLKAAEVEAGKGNFGIATGLFDDINSKAQAGMKAAAYGLEALDGGHYVSAHGPEVSQDETRARILTGKRPDGEVAPASKSSQFLDFGDFMATRELALADPKAVAAGVTTGRTTLKKGQQTQVVIKFDAGKDVGISFVGGLKKMGMDRGEFGETDVFENYEEMPGLTKVQSKFIFRFSHPDPSVGGFLKTIKIYETKYKAYHGVASVPNDHDYPGRWEINQHFPTPG